MWLGFYQLVMHGRLRIQVLGIQTVYGSPPVFNIAHLVHRRVAEWHSTGSKMFAPIAIKFKRSYTAYLGLPLTVVAVGLALRTAEDGLSGFAGMLAYFMINMYIVGPLVVSAIGDEFRTRRRSCVAETGTEVPLKAVA
jgi:hypothetical protein